MYFNDKAVATKLDRESKAFLDQAAATDGPPLEEMSVADARNALKELYLGAGEPDRKIARVADIKIPGPDGDIQARIYDNQRRLFRVAPVILFFHGGGWALGDVESYDNFCRFLAAKTGAIFISVEYRLSPENKFPAGLQDCLAGLEWVAANTKKLGGDPKRISVMGDSAGGNFAALAAIHARDHGIALSHQILLYPVLALDGGAQFPSRSELGNGDYFISQSSIAWTVDLYLETPDDALSPHATPLNQQNFEKLAPALIIVGGFDPLRDECKSYADRLNAAGVPAEFRCYHTTFHGFLSYSGAMPIGRKGLSDTAMWMRKNL